MFCFNVAHCRAILFVTLVEFLLSEYFFLCASFRFSAMLFDLYFLISVSAVPVGASDRVAGLLSRTWWQR